jgi:hypothetical protein
MGHTSRYLLQHQTFDILYVSVHGVKAGAAMYNAVVKFQADERSSRSGEKLSSTL